jgi:hypothetical protein
VDIGSYPFVRDGKVGTTLVARGTDANVLDAAIAEIERMLVSLGVETRHE